jgi:hypothetical protein
MKNMLRDSKKAIITIPAGVLLLPGISLKQGKLLPVRKQRAIYR